MVSAASKIDYPSWEDLSFILAGLGSHGTEVQQPGLTEAQLNWQVEPGKTWNIAQCLDQLAKTNAFYAAAMRSAALSARPRKQLPEHQLRPRWLEKLFIQSMDAPPRRKFQAPKKVHPAAFQSVEEVLAAFYRSHDELRSLIQDCAGIDINRIRFTSPFARWLRLSVGAGLLLIAAHERRHLWQAKQVRSSIDKNVSSSSS